MRINVLDRWEAEARSLVLPIAPVGCSAGISCTNTCLKIIGTSIWEQSAVQGVWRGGSKRVIDVISDWNPVWWRDADIYTGAAAYPLRIYNSVHNDAGYKYRCASLDDFID